MFLIITIFYCACVGSAVMPINCCLYSLLRLHALWKETCDNCEAA